MVKNKDMQLFMENLKMSRKRAKYFLTCLSFTVLKFFCPGFESSRKVRVTRSNQNKLLKEIVLQNMLTPLHHTWADLLTAARVKSLRAKALIIALKTAIKRLENQDRSVSRYVSLWFLSSLSLNPSM